MKEKANTAILSIFFQQLFLVDQLAAMSHVRRFAMEIQRAAFFIQLSEEAAQAPPAPPAFP